MTEKYVCTQCTGRSGEEHSFVLEKPPHHCPWCGTSKSYHLETLEEYLRQEIQDKDYELKRAKELIREKRERIRELEEELDE